MQGGWFDATALLACGHFILQIGEYISGCFAKQDDKMTQIIVVVEAVKTSMTKKIEAVGKNVEVLDHNVADIKKQVADSETRVLRAIAESKPKWRWGI